MEYIVGDIRFKDQNEALEYERKLKFADYLSKTRCYVVKYDESYGQNYVMMGGRWIPSVLRHRCSV